ncbi:GH25 family lysozyme [Mesorhizobium sp. WSM4887]|uniref:glycoside hydrolase family 25 protein n=1 Tax=Mesorhizobium sp. WSM4887 TaxID=3038543 RepID=UPI00241627B3|nr:GH25 family lysozyme [Mesorhizobium sp. WSM4887]MDG4889733.1 GH25 family lysozyme [Mesorhizobium sp. WSM4887]
MTDELSRADLMKQAAGQELGGKAETGPEDYSLWAKFRFPGDAIFDRVKNRDRDKSQFCLDISHHQDDDIDFSQLRLANVGCLYLKASQGLHYVDKKFQPFWQAVEQLPEAARVPLGGYHFLTEEDGAGQAAHYLDVMKSVNAPVSGNLVPVVDIEANNGVTGKDPDHWDKLSKEQIKKILVEWLAYVESHTKTSPIIYTAPLWWDSHLGPGVPPELTRYRFWIADLGNKQLNFESPRIPTSGTLAFWQFTWTARLENGYNKDLDASIFYGTADDLKAALVIP